ncbi:DNA polymerase II complex component [Scheffersomyces xylosifermentans]|uniref:DNA polymerase II complex component n=1 Tax=Scheffersomyces xylosifermentans TaxID=1304137 RepID=UPI00315D8385
MANRKPLHGLTFCCTGIPSKKREDIAEKIEALGGTHYSDLMSDVHYLLVGNRDTAKYKFCIKQRADITFLHEDSILKLYECWIKGEEDDSQALQIESYLYPVFDGMSVCISRIELDESNLKSLFTKSKFRKESWSKMALSEFFEYQNLTSLVTRHGGKPTESLTLGNTCVVSTEPQGRRYTKALEWKKPVVHPVWLFDSVYRGAALEFDDYILTKDTNNPYDTGCEVWKEFIDLTNAKQSNAKIGEESEAPIRRIKKNTEIWNSIMDHNKQQTKRVIRDSMWDDESEEETQSTTPHEDVATTTSTFIKRRHQEEHEKDHQKKHLFSGFNFLLIGFTSHQSKLLSQAIVNHNGEVSTDTIDSTITHIILPASKGSQSTLMLRILSPSIKAMISNAEIQVVTEWFIERSIFYNKVIIDRWALPMKGLVQASKPFKICITGFTGIELLHIEKLIKYMGFEFCDTLTSKRDLLIININLFKTNLSKNSPKLFQYRYPDVINCPTYQSGTSSVSVISSKNKINAAKSWEIPILSLAYLWEIMELSVHKGALVMPDLLNLTWCIYAPKNYDRPKSLMNYVKNFNVEGFERTKSAGPPGSEEEVDIPKYNPSDKNNDKRKHSQDESSDSIMKLPSPRKNNNKKQKFGRLVGRDSHESITSKLIRAKQSQESDEEEMQNNDVTNIEDEDMLSQVVGYQDFESIRNNEELLKKLEEEQDGDKGGEQTGERPVRRRARMSGKYGR